MTPEKFDYNQVIEDVLKMSEYMNLINEGLGIYYHDSYDKMTMLEALLILP